MGYSTENEIKTFLEQIGPKAFFVCDMDGNSVRAYKVREGHELKLGENDDPLNQSLPMDLPVRDIEYLVEAGLIERALFSNKRLDVRLSEDMVAIVNASIAMDQPFRLAFLTSRGEEDTRKILRASGVTDVDKVTLATDSGAIVRVNGVRTVLREPNAIEELYLKDVEGVAQSLQSAVEQIVRTHLPDFTGEVPALSVEKKKIATNIHWRTILEKTGQKEGSVLDDAISILIKEKLDAYAADGPAEHDGEPTFMTLIGPMTVEVKIEAINKSKGLGFITDKAVKAPAHQRPSSIVFTGDDVANRKGGPGTDWFAMDGITAMGHKHGIPTFNIHTHHPEGEDMNGTTPDPHKSPDRLSSQWSTPPIHLTVKTPDDMVNVIVRADDMRHLWETEAPTRDNDEWPHTFV